MVRILGFHCPGLGSIPGQGTEILKAVRRGHCQSTAVGAENTVRGQLRNKLPANFFIMNREALLEASKSISSILHRLYRTVKRDLRETSSYHLTAHYFNISQKKEGNKI